MSIVAAASQGPRFPVLHPNNPDQYRAWVNQMEKAVSARFGGTGSEGYKHIILGEEIMNEDLRNGRRELEDLESPEGLALSLSDRYKASTCAKRLVSSGNEKARDTRREYYATSNIGRRSHLNQPASTIRSRPDS